MRDELHEQCKVCVKKNRKQPSADLTQRLNRHISNKYILNCHLTRTCILLFLAIIFIFIISSLWTIEN